MEAEKFPFDPIVAGYELELTLIVTESPVGATVPLPVVGAKIVPLNVVGP